MKVHINMLEIERKLDEIFKNRSPKNLYNSCKYVIDGGGKRLRPLLLLLSARAGGLKPSKAINAAIAIELLHNFTLVHDDIMDNSYLRRGRATTHKKYDLSTAILAGDTILAIAYETLLKDCKNNCSSIVSSFTRGFIEVCEGQGYDKDFETREFVSISEYKKMIYKKTAVLLETCCIIGMQLANASKKEIDAAAGYGKNLGMAFQIQDDLLDIIGDEKHFGKITGSDLIEGKKTFLLLSALKKAKDDDLIKLMRVVKNRGITNDEVEVYKSIYDKLGIIEKAKKEIKSYTKLAIKSLDAMKNQECKELFIELAHSLIDRVK